MNCPSCKHKNSAAAKFCELCGALIVLSQGPAIALFIYTLF